MSRIRTYVLAASAAGAVGVAGAAPAVAVTTAPVPSTATTSSTSSATAGVNAVDRTFARKNEQTNLAEIALGKLALDRSHRPGVRHLARVTIKNHRTAKARLMRVAAKDGITLPKRPSKTQRAAARMLQNATAFNRKYLRVQIQGHKLSIAQTRKELRSGNNTRVQTYAKWYLPVAQMHLRMAQRNLQRIRNS
jgi:putative membrane protein